MARCELTGKGPTVKNLVSHSNIKTKVRANANVQNHRFHSQALNEWASFKIAASTIRTIENWGSFDSFILSMADEKMSKRAIEVRNRIRRKLNSKSKKAN